MTRHTALCFVLAGGLALAGCSGSDSAGGAVEEYCALNEEFRLANSSGSPDIFTEAGVAEFASRLAEVRAVAPDGIRPDVEAAVAVIDDLDGVLAAADYNFLAVEVVALEAVLGDTEADAVFERIDVYNEEQCGIPDSGDSGVFEGFGLDAEPGMTFGESMARQLAGTTGVSEEQANCVVDQLDMTALMSNDNGDDGGILAAFSNCGVALGDLGS
jgi:hypothetical protein